MSPEQLHFVLHAAEASKESGHLFPQMAACEAALESAFGASEIARADNNLFGMKQHDHPIYGTHNVPTREFERGSWIVVNAEWIHYPNWPDCFADRMATLLRLARFFPHYHNAINAGSPVTYITEVSRTWSTDPRRGEKVLAIYDEMGSAWQASS
jgi:flagellum-specific peptidoglycan hydrolase FlgJ